MIEHHFDLFRLELLADLAPEYLILCSHLIAMVRGKPGMTFGGNYAGKYIFSFRKLAFSDGLCTEVLNMQNFQNRAEDKHNAVIRPV